MEIDADQWATDLCIRSHLPPAASIETIGLFSIYENKGHPPSEVRLKALVEMLNGWIHANLDLYKAPDADARIRAYLGVAPGTAIDPQFENAEFVGKVFDALLARLQATTAAEPTATK